MKLIDQVCSFESAQKLQELGVKHECLFYWRLEYADWITREDPGWRVGYGDRNCQKSIPAYTTAELGELLVSTNLSIFGVYDYKTNEWSWQCFRAKTEAEQRALLLIYELTKKQKRLPTEILLSDSEIKDSIKETLSENKTGRWF